MLKSLKAVKEYTLKDLKKELKATTAPHAGVKARAVPVVVNFQGLSNSGVIRFHSTAVTTNGKDHWVQRVEMVDFKAAIALDDINMGVRDRANLAVFGDLKVTCNCLHGDTLIPLLDGRKMSIRELISEGEFWVYSTDDSGEFVPKKATAFKSGEVSELYEVTLDSGETVSVTGDHRFRMRDGSYVEASSLKEGDSLMPLYRRDNAHGYEEIKSNSGTSWKPTHRTVAELLNPCNVEDCLVVHHVSYNKRDNRPENLQWMEKVAHYKQHAYMIQHRYETDPVFRAKRDRGQKKFLKNLNDNPTDAMIISREENLSKGRGRSLTDEEKEMHSEKMKSNWDNPEFRRNVTESASRSWDERGIVLTDKMREAHRQNGLKAGKRFSSENTKKNAHLNRDPEFKKKQRIGRVVAVIKKLWENGLEVTEGNFRKVSLRNTPKPGTVPFKDSVGTLDEAQVIAADWNHSVIGVKRVKVESTEVFDLSVEGTQNFLIESGIVVHNCPAYLYWGYKYIASQLDYIKDSPESRTPKIRNPKLEGSVCKHLAAVLEVLPFHIGKVSRKIKKLRGEH